MFIIEYGWGLVGTLFGIDFLYKITQPVKRTIAAEMERRNV